MKHKVIKVYPKNNPCNIPEIFEPLICTGLVFLNVDFNGYPVKSYKPRNLNTN